MHRSITLEELVAAHKESLNLSWLTGQEFSQKLIQSSPEDISATVGFLNFVHPPQIVILGTQEFHYLAKLDINAYETSIKQFFASHPSVIILCDDQQATEEILQGAAQQQVPLLTTHLSAATILHHLSHFLSMHLAPSVTIHGVFMEVFDLGVLLTGASGVGKSELALELVNRGHRLIADDSPIFAKDAPDVLTGYCPPLLVDFLEVRGLGIINVRAMFGHTAVKECKKLGLIVHVVDMSDPVVEKIDRLEGMHKIKEYLNVKIPEVTLPAGPGRSLSVLVEAAVHNQVLRKGGYHADEIFINRQSAAILDQS